MDDDLFASFSKPPPPSSAHPAGSTKLDSSAPLGNDARAGSSRHAATATASKAKGAKGDKHGAKAVKRPLSPQDPPVDQDSLKKLKQDSTATGTMTSGTTVGEPFAVTDELEITAQTTVRPSAGLGGGAGGGAAGAGAAEGTTAQEEEGLVLQHQVRHQVALPPAYPYTPISSHVPPAEPARTYPFELDPFQKVSVASIQRNESVLVSAHTSAGKTVVAEYAIAQCLKQGQRVVYTSPIKVRHFYSRSLPAQSELTRDRTRRPSRTKSTERCSPNSETSV